ncbi:hypothetical protein CYMTET_33947, partial [Cymbomonas tetramitiformis]
GEATLNPHAMDVPCPALRIPSLAGAPAVHPGQALLGAQGGVAHGAPPAGASFLQLAPGGAAVAATARDCEAHPLAHPARRLGKMGGRSACHAPRAGQPSARPSTLDLRPKARIPRLDRARWRSQGASPHRAEGADSDAATASCSRVSPMGRDGGGSAGTERCHAAGPAAHGATALGGGAGHLVCRCARAWAQSDVVGSNGAAYGEARGAYDDVPLEPSDASNPPHQEETHRHCQDVDTESRERRLPRLGGERAGCAGAAGRHAEGAAADAAASSGTGVDGLARCGSHQKALLLGVCAHHQAYGPADRGGYILSVGGIRAHHTTGQAGYGWPNPHQPPGATCEWLVCGWPNPINCRGFLGVAVAMGGWNPHQLAMGLPV